MTTRRLQQTHGARWLLAAAILMLAVPDAASAQVERKGFILNLGLGAARVSTSSQFGPGTPEIGVGTDFKIGYAPSDRLLLYYSNDAAFQSRPNSDDILATGLSGFGAMYFLDPGENSFYVDGAIGIAARRSISSTGGFDAGITGSGLQVGGGYEFDRHWLLDVDLIRNSFDGDFKTTTMRVAVIWLLY